MLVLNLKIFGSLQSSGNASSTQLKALRISLTASSKFVSHSNSTNTTDILSVDFELISFKLSTELRASSIRRVTLLSISEALAPG